jgi:hypothetical protein
MDYAGKTLQKQAAPLKNDFSRPIFATYDYQTHPLQPEQADRLIIPG